MLSSQPCEFGRILLFEIFVLKNYIKKLRL